jgi:hypothetical protein
LAEERDDKHRDVQVADLVRRQYLHKLGNHRENADDGNEPSDGWPADLGGKLFSGHASSFEFVLGMNRSIKDEYGERQQDRANHRAFPLHAIAGQPAEKYLSTPADYCAKNYLHCQILDIFQGFVSLSGPRTPLGNRVNPATKMAACQSADAKRGPIRGLFFID